MKKWQFVLAACVVALAGCAHFDRESCRLCVLDGFDRRSVQPPQPLLPNVFVTDRGQLVVDQEPIRIDRRHVRNGTVTISWALEAGSSYTFPSTESPYKDPVDGIVIGPGSSKPPDKPGIIIKYQPDIIKCGVLNSQKKVFACTFRPPPEGRTRYKYTVNVLQDGKRLEALDPDIEGSY